MHTADSQFAHWLQWFCDDRTPQPFAVPDGRVCGSDGKIAVITAEAVPITPLVGRLANVPERVAGLLALPLVKSRPMLFAQLAEMFQPHVPITTTTCDRCHGKKKVQHICECELCNADEENCDQCDATGVIDEYPQDKRCLMFGEMFDWHRLSYLFAHVPPTLQCEVGIVAAITDEDTATPATLRIITDEWTAVVSSMDKRVAEPMDARELI